MAHKDIFQVISDYCRQVRFGEIYIKIKVHQGEAVEIEETQPPLRRFRKETLDKT